MPQLWLTYQELADELSCTPDEARSVALDQDWTRKRSRDGYSRVLLPRDLMHAYFAGAAKRNATVDAEADTMIGLLRSVLPQSPARRHRAMG